MICICEAWKQHLIFLAPGTRARFYIQDQDMVHSQYMYEIYKTNGTLLWKPSVFLQSYHAWCKSESNISPEAYICSLVKVLMRLPIGHLGTIKLQSALPLDFLLTQFDRSETQCLLKLVHWGYWLNGIFSNWHFQNIETTCQNKAYHWISL